MLCSSTLRRKSAPVAWLLAALLVFAPLGHHAAGAVLCIEADGRIAVESGAGASCGSDAAPAEDLSHCGSCTDVPLPSGGDTDCAALKVESGPTAQVLLPLVATLPALAPLGDQRGFQVFRSPLRGPSDLVPLCSVVLLI